MEKHEWLKRRKIHTQLLYPNLGLARAESPELQLCHRNSVVK